MFLTASIVVVVVVVVVQERNSGMVNSLVSIGNFRKHLLNVLVLASRNRRTLASLHSVGKMNVKQLDTVVTSEQSVQDLIHQLRPEWKSEKLAVRSFEGGVTNRLYGVRPASAGEHQTLLVRIFGEGSDLFLDREREKKCISYLHQYKLAEPLHASFANGFVYGYAVGTPLTVDSLRSRDLNVCVARQLGSLHTLPAVSTEASNACHKPPAVLQNLQEWSRLGLQPFADETMESRAAAIIPNRASLKEEVDMLSAELAALQSPVVFCHNDSTPGNILTHENYPEKVTFIDFEYADWNLRCFELGNMFCEYCGVDNMDFSLYPSKVDQVRFLKAYAAKIGELQGLDNMPDVERLYQEACMGALASNLLWGLWGLVQAAHSSIDFDYLDYARIRLDEYFRRKAEFVFTTDASLRQ